MVLATKAVAFRVFPTLGYIVCVLRLNGESRRRPARYRARLRDLERHLVGEVDNSPLIVFRILFGLLLAAEAGGAILTGWVKETLILPDINFPILPFTLLRPLPGNQMYPYFIVMAVAGLLVAKAEWHYFTANDWIVPLAE